jgi:hypothetical protein
MGQHISAIICKPSVDVERASEFDLPIIRSGDFVILPMDARHSDDWTERLGIGFGGSHSKVIFDGRFAHHVAAIVAEVDYALIETDYFGGAGDQVAAVYLIGQELPIFASDRVPSGAINEALKLIGVHARKGSDEFDTLGLGAYRDFEDYFEHYYE